MDVPKGFAIKKDLTTEELLDQTKQTTKKNELETLLEEFNKPNYSESEFFHMTVEALVQKKDYKSLTNQNLGWEYWTKPKNKSDSYILIRENKGGKRHYSLVTVNSNNSEEFCKRFTKRVSYKKFYNPLRCLKYAFKSDNDSLVGVIYSGLFTAFLGAFSTAYIAIYHFGTTVNYTGIGALLGFYFGSSSYSLYSHLSNKRKTRKIYKELITDEKKAIKKAFS